MRVSAPRDIPRVAPAHEAPGEPSTRQRLVDAAIAVFREEGYERARVQDIARRAGLTTGAIYANYRGKADLLLDAIAAASAAELDGILHDAEALPARTLIESLGARVPFRPDRRPLLLDAAVAAQRDPELAELLRDRLEARQQRFRRLLERARADGGLDPALDLDTVTRFCTTLALGSVVTRALALAPPDHAAWEALVARLLDALGPPEEQP